MSMMARRSRPTTPGQRPGRKQAKSPLTPAATSLLENMRSRGHANLTNDADLTNDINVTGKVNLTKLPMSLDCGTKTASMAFRLPKYGKDPTPADVQDVHFSERDYYAPQQVAWDQNDKFYWGYEVDEALKTKLIRPEDVIQLWKLLLYRAHESSPMAQRIKKQLGRRTVADLISTHLRALVAVAKDYIKRSPTSFDFSSEEIDAMPVQLFLSVPQMWKTPANRIMTEAAKLAGIEHVELVYEPQCAAAYYTHKIKDSLPRQLKVGDVLMIADVGGGTGDFVSYEFRTDSDAGSQVRLRSIGVATGALCGSVLVTEHFLGWLQTEAMEEEDAADFEALCELLGLTAVAFLKQASDGFEPIKQGFSVPEAKPCDVFIRGTQGAKLPVWVKEDIVRFFEPVIQEIFRCIDAQLTERTKTVIIPGGFGRSVYLINRLRERYSTAPPHLTILGQSSDALGAYQPVSRGALLRYKDIQARGLPSKESFGIGRVETWDPEIHSDATLFAGVTLKNGRVCHKTRPNPRLVEEDPYDRKLAVVYERWEPLLKKGEYKVPGKTFTTTAWHQYCVKKQEKEISVQVYWTEADMTEHDPMVDGMSVIRGTIKPGIEPWGAPLVKKLPDLKALGFKLEDSGRGKVYELLARLLLTCDGANVSINWQIALPGTAPYNENGEARPSANLQLTPDEVYELVDAAYNPIPRTSPT